jgi:hypothetical protein
MVMNAVENSEAGVWVFSGPEAGFPSAVFSTRENADAWIEHHRLSGTLTQYPLDGGVYEWAIDRGLFRPKRPAQSSPAFVGTFTCAGMEHHHYEDGHVV